jgi:hypothetical protein
MKQKAEQKTLAACERISFFFPVYNDAKTVEPLTVALRDTLVANCREFKIYFLLVGT